MSTEEQDTILGQLVRTKQELARELGGIEFKMSGYASALSRAGQLLSPKLVVQESEVADSVKSIPDKYAILELMNELSECKRKLSETQHSLNCMGVH